MCKNFQQRDAKHLAAVQSQSLKYINNVSIDTFTSLAVDFRDRLDNQASGNFEKVCLFHRLV